MRLDQLGDAFVSQTLPQHLKVHIRQATRYCCVIKARDGWRLYVWTLDDLDFLVRGPKFCPLLMSVFARRRV